MSAGELILYRSEDGRAEIQLRAEGDTVWLTQAEMAELFDTTPQAITQHIRAIYEEGELSRRQLVRIPYKFARRASVRCGAGSRPTACP